MSAVAFFPWVHLHLNEPILVGDIRLLPFIAGARPGDSPCVTQAQLDAVFKAYCNHPRTALREATLLEVGFWRTGMPCDDPTLERLFQIRTAVTFSALAARSLFRGHYGYTNASTYQLVVQRYDPEQPARFAFITRRRDGGTSHTWASDRFAFERPHAVGAHERFSVDLDLLAALTQPDMQPWLYEALLEFNGANTDSSDVPEHVELVMSKTALEWLLQVGEKWQDFSRALRSVLPSQHGAEGPLRSAWQTKYKNAPDLIGAWAQEFCNVRNWSAHADPRDERHFVWGTKQHLAFAAVLVPLLVKRLLAVEGHYQMREADQLLLQRLSRFLMHDPFAHDPQGEEDHPWLAIDLDARMRAISFAYV